MTGRSRMLMDIEHDLNLISTRLHKLEDHFEDGGVVDQIAQAVHQLAIKIEALEHARQVGDADVG